MIDSHCHLYFDSLINDFSSIIERAKKNNITAILSINTKPDEFNNHYKLVEKYKSIFLSFGLHPGNVTSNNVLSVSELINYCKNTKVIGVGETGLDFYYSKKNKKQQIQSFENHIQCSYKTNLPLIIHQRNSEIEIMEILNTYQKTQPLRVVFHCFTGSKKLRDFCLDNEYYISLSGIITFKNSQELRNTISTVPIESILIETDSPFLTPVPFRGKNNEPSLVKYVAEYLSNYYKISIEEFINFTDNNFYKLFSKAIRYNEISL